MAAADLGRKIAGALTILGCIAALVGGGWLAKQVLAQPLAVPRRPPAAEANQQVIQDAKTLQEESQKLRDESSRLREATASLQAALDGARREADGFRWLLTVILSLGALYSLFQGVYSYLNVQELKVQAKAAIDTVVALRDKTDRDMDTFQANIRTKSKADFDGFRADCVSQFPMFAGVENVLRRMATRLEMLFNKPLFGENSYRALDPMTRQEIFYFEKSAAWLEFIAVTSPADRFDIFRGLIRFYRDKYLAERKDATTPGNRPADPDDLKRAEYYLERADLLSGQQDFRVLNERGYMAYAAPAAPDWDRAKKFFGLSIELHNEQQCAHYNLARFAHYKGNVLRLTDAPQAKAQFEQAVRTLRTASRFANWEDAPILVKFSSIYYNLACALCRLAQLSSGPERDSLLEESFVELGKSVAMAPGARGHFEQDRHPGEDLELLDTDARYRPRLDDFASAISKART